MRNCRFFRNILYILLLLAVTLNSSYALITINDTIPILFLAIGVAVTSTLLLMRKGKIAIDFVVITVFGLFLVFMLIMLIHNDLSVWGSYVRQALVILLAFNIVRLWSFRTVGEFYVKIMIGICCLSLSLSAVIQLTNIKDYLPVVTNPNRASYYNLWIIFARTNSQRCLGPFWEPGILATFLLIALLIEMCFLQRKPSWKTIVLFVVTIIMTFSTAGYILMLFVLLIGFNSMYFKKVPILLDVVCLVFIILIATSSETILKNLAVWNPTVFEKTTYDSVSLTTRVNGPLVDLSIWAKSFITGAGVKNYQYDWELLANIMSVDSRTSTITYFVAVFGMGGLAFAFWVLRGCLRQKGLSPLMRIALLVVFVSLLTKEPHYYNVAMMMFLLYLNRDMRVIKHINHQQEIQV